MSSEARSTPGSDGKLDAKDLLRSSGSKSLSTTSLPLILTWAYSNVKILENGKRSADCTFCPRGKKTKLDNKKTTSNFRNHLKDVHKAAWKKFLAIEKGQRDAAVVSAGQAKVLTCFVLNEDRISCDIQLARNTKLNSAMIKFLIITDDGPLNIGEKVGFQQFCALLDPSWQPLSCSAIVQNHLPAMTETTRNNIRATFQGCATCSLSLDVWTGQGKCVFMAVTAHGITKGFKLHNALLSVSMLTGAHSESSIFTEFQKVTKEYGLQSNVYRISTHSSSNLTSALNTPLPGFGQHNEEPGDFSELVQQPTNRGLDCSKDAAKQSFSEEARTHFFAGQTFKRSPRFADALALVITDGFNNCASIPGLTELLNKIAKLVSKAHQNTEFHDAFVKHIGLENMVAPTITRWINELTQMRALLKFDPHVLNDMLVKLGWSMLCLTDQDVSICRTFVCILKPFEQSIEKIRGTSCATIGIVAPHIVGLLKALNECFFKPGSIEVHGNSISFIKSDILRPFVAELKRSLELRFGGLLLNCGFNVNQPKDQMDAFGDNIYLIAAFLDPNYKDIWVSKVPTDAQLDLKAKIRELVVQEVLVHQVPNETIESFASSATRKVNLTAGKRKLDDDDLDYFESDGEDERPLLSIKGEVDAYYACAATNDCLKFWATQKTFPGLKTLAEKIYTIPTATPAGTEKTFSKMGQMQPHVCTSFLPGTLNLLMFLKCNLQYLSE